MMVIFIVVVVCNIHRNDGPMFDVHLLTSILIQSSLWLSISPQRNCISATSNLFSFASLPPMSSPITVLVWPLSCNISLDLLVHPLVKQHSRYCLPFVKQLLTLLANSTYKSPSFASALYTYTCVIVLMQFVTSYQSLVIVLPLCFSVHQASFCPHLF